MHPSAIDKDEEETVRLFEEIGFDVSVKMWTFRYRLRGGAAGDL